MVGLTLTVSVGLAGSSIADWRGILIAMCALVLALSKNAPVILILALSAADGEILYGLS